MLYELYAKYTVNRATSLSYLVTWSPEVWTAFLLTMFVIVVCMWLVAKIRHFISSADVSVVHPRQTQQSDTESPSLISYFFIVWGSICSQGLHTVNTNACSVRVVSWVTLLFGLCISTSYSAVLFSRLTVDKSDLVIPSLESLSRLRTHAVCVRRNSFGYLLFKANETDTFIMERWLGVVNVPPCPQYEYGDIEVMAKSVCNDQALLVLETPMVMSRAMSHQDGCRVMSVAGRHAVAYASVLTVKGSPYTPLINEMQVHIIQIMVSLLTNGVVDYLQKKWLSREFRDWTFTEADSIGVTIGHVQGLLIVLVLSFVVATVIMLVELATAGSNLPMKSIPFRDVGRNSRNNVHSISANGIRWRKFRER
ncbi:Glutamate receptor delta-1 subunit [Aphis craccivora]|uniref:Glutamate receptor delta-1 subunit n=1 Tax=Aphis craccivora TaxID=307492 RepID=A0A6G0ZHM7_APHCR|nr:Glutamate receptor delta-1 subunit [Aphis craccivora]